jgi:undecaprenyl-diphosphatase
MQLLPIFLSAHARSSSLWLGAAALGFGIFIKITSELLEHEVRGIDSVILTAVATARRPWLTGVAVDVTALGSLTLVALISAVALCIFISLEDHAAAWQLLLSSVGAGIWTVITKNVIERARPEGVTHLVHVSGFSYPSGHSLVSASLYLTIAVLAGRHLPTMKVRILLFVLAIGCHFAGRYVAGLLGCTLPERRRQRRFVRSCLGSAACGWFFNDRTPRLMKWTQEFTLSDSAVPLTISPITALIRGGRRQPQCLSIRAEKRLPGFTIL